MKLTLSKTVTSIIKMLRTNKSVMILQLKIHFPNINILCKNTLFHTETRLNAEM